MTQQGTGYQGISNYLKNTLIPSLTTVRVQNIYDYEVTDLAGYPSATVTITETLGTPIDNNRNERTYRFVIRIFIERSEERFNSQGAENITRQIADEIISKFDVDITLGGNCIYSKPVSVKYGYVDRQDNNIRVAEIQLDCIDAITYK